MALPSSSAHDRSVARRYGFLGMPNERQGAPSFAELQNELGTDNANNLHCPSVVGHLPADEDAMRKILLGERTIDHHPLRF